MITEKHYLYTSTGEDMPESVKSLLFGVLMDKAAPVVDEHRSDFYHDALFIHRRDRAELEEGFFYAFGNLGTLIGTGSEHLIRSHRYRVQVERDGDSWMAVLTEV